MKLKPILEKHYGENVLTNPTTDKIRRDECLCLYCSNMTYDEKTNCKIAQKLSENCGCRKENKEKVK